MFLKVHIKPTYYNRYMMNMKLLVVFLEVVFWFIQCGWNKNEIGEVVAVQALLAAWKIE